MKITDVLHEHSVVNPGNTLVEAGEWKAEAEDFKEWSNHVKDTLLGVDPSQRFAMAKRLSQIEMKHFGAGQATASGSFNNQTGRPTGNTSGMTTTVEHILDAINAGKLNKSSSPDTTAAVASAGTTQQTPFGSVTRPAGQPDPYHASPATQYGDRPAAQAAQNRPRPQQGGGSIRILRTEQDWEEALSDPDSGRDLDADNPVTTAAGFDKEMSKLPSWKVMLATIMLGLKLPIVGDKIKNLLVSSIQKNFGITMSPKEALEYMKHVRNTPGDQIVPPAVWKFERDGGDYETAIEQLPDDAVEVRPAEVMSAIATDLIDAGVAQEIETGNKPKDEPEDETPSNAGAGAFGNMSSQLTKKDKELAESTELATILKYAGIPLTEGVLDDTRARMDARRNPTAAQPATAPVAADDGYKVGDVVEYWTGMKMPQNPQRGTIISIVKNQGGEEITVRTDNGLENRLDTRNKSQIIRKVAPIAEPAGQEPTLDFDDVDTQEPAAPATKPPAVDAKGRTQDQWEKAVMAKYPDAQIQKSMGIDSPS